MGRSNWKWSVIVLDYILNMAPLVADVCVMHSRHQLYLLCEGNSQSKNVIAFPLESIACNLQIVHKPPFLLLRPFWTGKSYSWDISAAWQDFKKLSTPHPPSWEKENLDQMVTPRLSFKHGFSLSKHSRGKAVISKRKRNKHMQHCVKQVASPGVCLVSISVCICSCAQMCVDVVREGLHK